VLGGRARLVLDHPEIDAVYTTEATFEEVREYAVALGRKKKIGPAAMMLTVAALPVSIVASDDYNDAKSKARELIGRRDPDDVEILALALHLNIPLWSNDNDFEECGIEWYTTAELLRKLGIVSANEKP
jgi:predicted nucleic acid-binding protein